MPAKLKDITGQRFGRLVVIRRAEGCSKHEARWVCICDCAAEATVIGSRLRNGQTVSCGCYAREQSSLRLQALKPNITHGLANKIPEYGVWKTMKARCHNPNTEKFKEYGGRGIVVCDRWFSFENFLSDMGRRPSPKHSIERIDVNGNYAPENCRWATAAEQRRNRRDGLRLIEFNGETLCLSDWASRIGISFATLVERIERHPLEVALTAPKGMR